MNKFHLGSAFAALLAAPLAANAQNLPPAVVAVVDTDRIVAQCTVCIAANTQLQAQGQALQTRAQALAAQIETEARALQPLVNAVPAGGQPDAALGARIQSFQVSQQNADREIGAGRERLQRNVQFVRQQIGQRVQPAIVTVMQQRGANVAVDRGATLAHNPVVEVTDAVLAIVNQNTAPLNVNAPLPAQPAATPPATTPPQPNRPRPQGR